MKTSRFPLRLKAMALARTTVMGLLAAAVIWGLSASLTPVAAQQPRECTVKITIDKLESITDNEVGDDDYWIDDVNLILSGHRGLQAAGDVTNALDSEGRGTWHSNAGGLMTIHRVVFDQTPLPGKTKDSRVSAMVSGTLVEEDDTPMKELRTEIEIQASDERVWQLLTDFASFPQWNPFIRRASGEAKAGARLEVYIQPSGARGMTFKPTVLKAEPNRELRWLGRLLMPGLFDGEHVFTLEPLGTNRVRFTQREVFTGLLVPLFARGLDTDTRRGFEEMNRALKARAEQS